MQTYDLTEASAFLKVSPQVVLELAALGELPGAKIGKAWVFADRDLQDYLIAQVRAQTTERRSTLGVVPSRVPTAFSAVKSRRGQRQTLDQLREEAAARNNGVPAVA